MRRLSGPWLLTLVALSGCAGAGDDFAASGDDARVLPRYSYAYDGVGVHVAQGTVSVEADSASDTGAVRARVVHGTIRYAVDWVRFEGNASHHSGGVARNVRLHGATGNESAALPEFFAYAAGWGWATMRVNDEVQRDPTTGSQEFPARVIVVRGHVRDPGDGVIYDAGRTRPYDPGAPTDGSVDPQGAQVLLELRTRTGDLWYHFEFERVALERV